MHNFFPRLLRLLKWSFLFLVFASFCIFFILRASLPDISGTKKITLLNQSVKIERDAQGIPTIHSKHRLDTAFALGYVHAQERFFQMDLLRRSAAGELAELFGDDAYENDIKVRIHRFKERARKAIRKLPKMHYATLLSYSNGVNTGIEALINDPYQYLLLGQLPKQWQPEDTLLCIYAMYFDLNDELGEIKTSRAILKDELPQQWFDFLMPEGGKWDAAMDNSNMVDTQLEIPELALPGNLMKGGDQKQAAQSDFISGSNFLNGSNSWAIDASLTPYSSAMLANDMHLTLSVPNIWYRASWFLDDGRRMTGITLPGVPVLVAGSNEKIAWGFVNSYGDWGKIITLETNKEKTQYRGSDGWKNFILYDHVIYSSSGHSKEHVTIETQWGPVIGTNHKGELLVHQWLAYAPQAVNLNFLELEGTLTTKGALNVATTLGMPSQGIVITDDKGHVGWTIAGLIPDRNSEQGQDFLSMADYPVLSDPDNHRIWVANNRLFTGDKLSIMGFEGGALGARAQQIRDGLQASDHFNEEDLLAMQLDTKAAFLQRWKQLMLDTLESANARTVDSPKIASHLLMIEALKAESDFSADADSVAYGLVRAFRRHIVNQSVGWIFDAIEKKHQGLFKRVSVDKMIEYPVWELITKKPQHLIPAAYANWDELFIASAQTAYNEITQNGQKDLARQTWGMLHKIKIQHPLSAAVPGLGLLLDMPDSPLSGDDFMPKVAGSGFGASMRMVVSPGHEENGIMNMPTGQSSHPLSSYFSTGHQDWVDGKPSAFLPGKTKWTLELKSIQ